MCVAGLSAVYVCLICIPYMCALYVRTGVSPTDEAGELRCFRSVEEWRGVLHGAGFAYTMLSDVEPGALYVCLVCMPYMHALYACLICMLYMHALYACLICMPYIGMPYVYALHVCLHYAL